MKHEINEIRSQIAFSLHECANEPFLKDKMQEIFTK